MDETGLHYWSLLVDLGSNDQASLEFLSLNTNNKISALIDLNGSDGKPLRLVESNAILMYLAKKAGRLVLQTAPSRYTTI